ncbi:glycoside hydrolase family 88 protein [Pendulispora rubella]|uniref:Glycoside hydrolase family 88 protein n=1 Tax=Pendulispora rubella TaxID=2741070 RepID=A0ABZ2L2C9_9BACT
MNVRLRHFALFASLGTSFGVAACTLPAEEEGPASPASEPAALSELSEDLAPPEDWSVAIVESTMKRFTPSSFGGWGYTQGLYLWGQYLVYKRTHNPRYLEYIKQWVDRFVDANGHISNSFNDLDSMESGNVVLALYQETGQAKYRTAATQIRNRLKTYPRTSDAAFWHSTSLRHQLWADGVFMVAPFVARYGQTVGESTYANDESSNQLALYGRHLIAADGILYHAYDEAKAQSWANPTTGLSPEKWCRAVGWYAMASIDILEILPADHPRRAPLLTNVSNLVSAFERYQDPASGRWFQVVDKGSVSGNWTETSCSAMYTYVTSRAVQRGYVPSRFGTVASKGYQGVLARMNVGSDGLTNVTQICVGTGAGGSLSYYFNRPRATNDLHGLGAVLIMNEQLAHGASPM